jgi:hypothetical protein
MGRPGWQDPIAGFPIAPYPRILLKMLGEQAFTMTVSGSHGAYSRMIEQPPYQVWLGVMTQEETDPVEPPSLCVRECGSDQSLRIAIEAAERRHVAIGCDISGSPAKAVKMMPDHAEGMEKLNHKTCVPSVTQGIHTNKTAAVGHRR